ncbi:hypothetical protein THZG08_160062 [Vibrio owensii]|nr:hypothetical protein THZG08_160062 [Vibrio owensii]CAH1553412.1 hypothetical protein THOA03_160062 [Vibrio owensii]
MGDFIIKYVFKAHDLPHLFLLVKGKPLKSPLLRDSANKKAQTELRFPFLDKGAIRF